MGSCISKCSSATKDCNPIQEMIIIIPQQSPFPSLPTIRTYKKPHSPSLSSSSSTNTTTTTITTSTATLSSTSTLSSFSSCLSKDGSFSNELLWSCIKENPQIIQVEENPKKKTPHKSLISTSQTRKSRAVAAPPKQSIPGCTQLEQPRKARRNSPSPTRQRSSSKEPERQKSVSLPNRNSGSQSPTRSRRFDCRGLSPSPSRGFNGVACRDLSKNSQEANRKRGVACGKFNGDTCKGGVGFAGNSTFTVAAGKENCRPRRGDCGLRTQPQFDQNVVGEMVSNHDSNSSVSVQDIDNPLISLDCFIFL